MRDREHRDAGAGVVLAPVERQRPEVRRCPEKDHQREQHRRHAQAAGHRRPGDQRRRGPGGAADDDVLGRAPLEPDGVDHRVIDDREHADQRRGQIGEGEQRDPREAGEHETEAERARRRQRPGRQWTARGPEHQAVDVAIDVVVEGGGRGRGERDAGERSPEQGGGRESACGDQQRGHSGEEDERHDARLGQFPEVEGLGPGERRQALARH